MTDAFGAVMSAKPDSLRKLLLIGIGAGNPDYLTLQAVKALALVDVIFLTNKGEETGELLQARRAICAQHMQEKPYRTVEITDPERDRSPADYRQAVEVWHTQRALAYEQAILQHLAPGECGGFLVWGDPALYDSALRIIEQVANRARVAFDWEIIPGISSIQALAARHKISLNEIGEPIHITTGRQLRDNPNPSPATTVVMLDGQCAFQALKGVAAEVDIYWGAYLGMPDEILLSGKLSELSGTIIKARAQARTRKGWIMDTYLLRGAAPAPIPALNETVRAAAHQRLNGLTKPLGALGDLEVLAAQLCAIQGTLDIHITQPVGVVFAADHGIAESGVSAFPRAVTAQMVSNFLGGGAAISVLAKLNGIQLWIVDAGVDATFAAHPQFIDEKIRRGTRNFLHESAMTDDECALALGRGRHLVEQLISAGSNTVILGEMGIGNTASAAILLHGLTGIPLRECVGRGTGLDDSGLESKRALLARALERQAIPSNPLALLTAFGGYEIAMLVGAMLEAAVRRAVILVDGFTVSVAAALAAAIDPRVLDYCIFSHASAEHAHRALLAHLKVKPLLDLGMRLGEGSGAAAALPLVRAAVALFTEMATFEAAGVSVRES